MKYYWILLLIFLTSCHSSNTVIIHTATEEIPVIVEIAESVEEQTIGLMFRTELAQNSGMLFVFEDMQKRGFWMKNTKIPLDIMFIDSDGIIVDVKENFQPCTTEDCDVYFSAPAQYVLEVNAGFVQQYTIHTNDAVTFK